MSGRLWTLLSSNHDASTEIEEIADNPGLKAEARAFCIPLAQLSAAAGEHAVKMALAPLVLVYGVSEATRSPAFWEAYRILSGLPAEALRLGIEEYIAQPDSQFFPKPGPLKALCDKHASPIFKAAYRASKAAAAPERRMTHIPSDDERAEVRRMMDEFTRTVAERSPASVRPQTPSTAGKPDAGGLTPQMRDLMARQHGETS